MNILYWYIEALITANVMFDGLSLIFVLLWCGDELSINITHYESVLDDMV